MKQHEEGNKFDLMKYRLESAKSDLKSAKILIEAEEYRAANNRAYYAIFHAISAIHALDGKAYKRHKDALGSFNREYVKTEVFPREVGKKISRAEEIRHIKMKVLGKTINLNLYIIYLWIAHTKLVK